VMTPERIARRIAGTIEPRAGVVRLLDAGAGAGMLTAATVERLLAAEPRPTRIEVTAFEIDPVLADLLGLTFAACADRAAQVGVGFDSTIRREDFLVAVASEPMQKRFNVAVLNPPYRKLRTDSDLYRTLARVGLESTNLYTAFWGAVLSTVEYQGQVVAITPRSFCNGTYFRPFRERLLGSCAIRSLVVHESRQDAFSDDEVLQETVITSVELGGHQGPIELGTVLADDVGTVREVAFSEVVHVDDRERFIRFPSTDDADRVRSMMTGFAATIDDLDVSISTGRVVDFRATKWLTKGPEVGAVPLIYPSHLIDGHVRWPLSKYKKFNGISQSASTESLLVRNGTYVLVKRFSAKEEPRRVVAALYDGSLDCDVIGFENKLNYFHTSGSPLATDLARGLCVYLNSSLVDEYFRQFSGHTQVNAGDLRSLSYPKKEQILWLSKAWRSTPTQETIDAAVYGLVPV
jgi:adenine-specific DNA-methyltransferase